MPPARGSEQYDCVKLFLHREYRRRDITYFLTLCVAHGRTVHVIPGAKDCCRPKDFQNSNRYPKGEGTKNTR